MIIGWWGRGTIVSYPTSLYRGLTQAEKAKGLSLSQAIRQREADYRDSQKKSSSKSTSQPTVQATPRAAETITKLLAGGNAPSSIQSIEAKKIVVVPTKQLRPLEEQTREQNIQSGLKSGAFRQTGIDVGTSYEIATGGVRTYRMENGKKVETTGQLSAVGGVAATPAATRAFQNIQEKKLKDYAAESGVPYETLLDIQEGRLKTYHKEESMVKVKGFEEPIKRITIEETTGNLATLKVPIYSTEIFNVTDRELFTGTKGVIITPSASSTLQKNPERFYLTPFQNIVFPKKIEYPSMEGVVNYRGANFGEKIGEGYLSVKEKGKSVLKKVETELFKKRQFGATKLSIIPVNENIRSFEDIGKSFVETVSGGLGTTGKEIAEFELFPTQIPAFVEKAVDIGILTPIGLFSSGESRYATITEAKRAFAETPRAIVEGFNPLTVKGVLNLMTVSIVARDWTINQKVTPLKEPRTIVYEDVASKKFSAFRRENLPPANEVLKAMDKGQYNIMLKSGITKGYEMTSYGDIILQSGIMKGITSKRMINTMTGDVTTVLTKGRGFLSPAKETIIRSNYLTESGRIVGTTSTYAFGYKGNILAASGKVAFNVKAPKLVSRNVIQDELGYKWLDFEGQGTKSLSQEVRQFKYNVELDEYSINPFKNVKMLTRRKTLSTTQSMTTASRPSMQYNILVERYSNEGAINFYEGGTTVRSSPKIFIGKNQYADLILKDFETRHYTGASAWFTVKYQALIKRPQPFTQIPITQSETFPMDFLILKSGLVSGTRVGYKPMIVDELFRTTKRTYNPIPKKIADAVESFGNVASASFRGKRASQSLSLVQIIKPITLPKNVQNIYISELEPQIPQSSFNQLISQPTPNIRVSNIPSGLLMVNLRREAQIQRGINKQRIDINTKILPSMAKLGQIDITKTKEFYSQKVIPDEIIIPKIKDDIIIIPRSHRIIRQSQRIKINNIDVPIPKSIKIPNIDIPIIPPPEIPFIPVYDGQLFGGSRNARGKRKRSGRKYAYRPTLRAFTLGIRGKAPKGALTGFEERPIIVPNFKMPKMPKVAF